MSIKKELSDNQTILILLPSADYSKESVKNVKALASSGSVCYVTLNKTSEALKELFKKNKVKMENIVFIDAISKTIKKTPKQGDNVYFVTSPGALTEISILINKFLRHEFGYLVLDSLTNILTYQKQAPVAKFVSSLVNKIKIGKTKTVFYAIKMEDQSSTIHKCSMAVDQVIDLEKK